MILRIWRFAIKKIIGLFRLLRFELPFAAGVCVVMGQLLALGTFASMPQTIFGFWSVFFVSASILVLNDFFDVETDMVNSPTRPIPSKLVTKSEALLFSLLLLFSGLALGCLIGVTAFVVTVLLTAIGFLYNRFFKKNGLPGNLLVSVSVGTTFIYGGISAGLPFHKLVWLFAAIAALVDLGEEIAADAMDIEGDILIDSNSLAIRYGKRTALTISSGIFGVVILLTALPFILDWLPALYLLPIIVMDAAIAYSTIRLLRSRDQEGRKFIRWIYLGSTLGLLVFIVMRLVEGK